MNRKELGLKIKTFIFNYAKEGVDGKFNSPDAYALLNCAECLIDEEFDHKNLRFPDSTFYQGGYKSEGESEHEEIMDLLDIYMNPYCNQCEKKVHLSHNFCIHCGAKR
jgi:hypothetical protein